MKAWAIPANTGASVPTRKAMNQMASRDSRADNQSVGDMAERMPRRRGPQQRGLYEVKQDLSESHRDFKDHISGLSNRLPLASVDGMLAGTVMNPHSLVRRYLVAARTVGLPKEWALKFSVWTSRQIDVLWPMESTPLAVLQERAMRAEGEDDVRELRCAQEWNAITLRERIQSLTNEVTADMLCLARLEREMENR